MLKAGFVLVGNVPSADGTSAMVKAGSLLVLNRTGDIVAQWTPAMAKIDGPWDLTIFDQGNQAKVFVSNVLNGTVIHTTDGATYQLNGDCAHDRATLIQLAREQHARLGSSPCQLFER